MLDRADVERMRQIGFPPLSRDEGLALLDLALGADRAQVLAIGLEPAGLRNLAALGVLPPILTGLVRVPKRRAAAAGSLTRQLAEMPEAEREAAVLELVRSQVASILGHESAADIDPERAFQELGFDSLAALELRNRLNVATGLRLGATVVFDYPSSASLAAHLLERVGSSGAAKVTLRAPQTTDEPIAIVGMSCRYPGGVASPQELWRAGRRGRRRDRRVPRRPRLG